MSAAVINLNPDLKRLQDEGYELEVREGCAIIYHVPYLDSSGTVQLGTLVSPLNMCGDRVKCNNHTIYFQGAVPHHKDGKRMDAIYHSPANNMLGGVPVAMMFSNKPAGGYRDYYEKFTRYISLLSAEAQAVDPSVTAATFKRVVTEDDSVFCYDDTNASRAAITGFSDGLKNQKIGIIGLGGTGSYILDQVAKTPVAEIHLYDGDVFCQHNAFRAPGAPPKELFSQQPMKVDYFRDVYSQMHRHIFAHGYNLEVENLSELQNLNFVFLAMDSGPSKRGIVDFLSKNHISFVDTGIDVRKTPKSLIGIVRSTRSVGGDLHAIEENVSFEQANKDLYASNIQVADLNAMAALRAVIQWKHYSGFYSDSTDSENCIFSTDIGEVS